MWVLDEVGRARAVFFDQFQGCNLLGDEPTFKRREEIYKENQTSLPAQHLPRNYWAAFYIFLHFLFFLLLFFYIF